MGYQPTGGQTGRPKTPSSLAILRGVNKNNPGRMNENEPIPDSVTIEPPACLSPQARRIWDDIADDMIRKGVLTAWDVPAFCECLEAIVVARVARINVLAEQMGKIEPKRGSAAANSVWRTAWFVFNSGASKFGMTPADRARLIMPENEPYDDLISGYGR